jgi:hypothetical protein
MANFPPQVQRVIDQGYEFNFGDYLSKGFNIVGKQAVLYMAFTFVFFLILMVSNLIPFLGQLAGGLVLAPCLLAGFHLANRKVDDGQSIAFGDFFKGFEHWSQLLVAILIMFGIGLLLMLPVGLIIGFGVDIDAMAAGDISGFPWWAFLLLLPLIYLGVAWGFSSFLIIFHGMSAWPAMEASRQIISQKWFFFLLFGIVVGIIGSIGAIAFGIGMLFTLPAAYAMQFASFRDVVGMPDEATVSTLDHLVD